MKKTILLIQPRPRKSLLDIRFVPHGLLAIASVIDAFYKVVIIDRSVNCDESLIERVVRSGETLCVGLSVLTGGMIEDAIYLSKMIKKIDSGMPVVWGGWHATQVPLSIIGNEYVDYIIRGEGEEIFPQFIKRIEQGGDVIALCSVGYMGPEGPVINDIAQLPDLNEYDIAHYELLDDIEPYVIHNWVADGKRCLSFETSRGCPHGCSFCDITSFFGKSFRALSPDRVLEEMKYLHEKYGISGVRFWDANFFFNLNRAKDISRLLIGSGLDIKWGANGTVMQFRTLSIEDLLLFRESGLRMVSFGLESGNEGVRSNVLKKFFSNEDVFRIVDLFHQAGIQFTFSLIIGLPGESLKESYDTVDFALQIYLRYPEAAVAGGLIHIFMPLPGTPLYEKALLHGYDAPRTLSDYSDITSAGTRGMAWLSRSHFRKLQAIKLYSTFMFGTDSSIPLSGIKRFLFRLARKYSLFRLKHKLFMFTPDLWLLKRVIR